MSTAIDPAQAFLMGGGGGPPSIFNKADGIGTIRRITIESWEYRAQRDDDGKGNYKIKTWDSTGEPMMELVVTGQTDLRDPSNEDDDGKRRVFIKGDMKKAVGAAVAAAECDFIGRGGVLTVARIDKLPDEGKKSGAWIHQARYVPPAASFLTASAPVTGTPATPGAELDLSGPVTAAAPVAPAVNTAPAQVTPSVAEALDAAIPAAQANLVAAGMVAPAAAPVTTILPATPYGPVDPAVMAALAALPEAQRLAALKAMGVSV